MSMKLLLIGVGLLLFGGLERYWPFIHYRSTRWQRMGGNFAIGIGNTIATQIVLLGLSQYKLAATDLTLLPIVQFLLLDAYMYGWHWLMHHTNWGWRLHQLHHSDREMNISTAYRFHVMEVLLSQTLKLALIWVGNFSPNIVLLYDCCFAMSLLFHHSNWNLPMWVDRALSWFIVTPNYHRLHHSPSSQYQNANFASLLTIWDIISKQRKY
jgi:sterol desaturase/sphingolipid hydroxylase (fatty acid hydroxylase superfamily)